MLIFNIILVKKYIFTKKIIESRIKKRIPRKNNRFCVSALNACYLHYKRNIAQA